MQLVSKKQSHKSFRSQFALPEGPAGWLAGWLLDLKNRRRGKWVTDSLTLAPGAQVLEIGFGPGRDLLRLARRGYLVSGVDPSAVMLQMAERKLRRLGSRGCRLVQGVATALPFPAESFDVVFSTNSVQFWDDLEAGIEECVRVLKPGGQLLIAISPRNRGATQATVTEWGERLLHAMRNLEQASSARLSATPVDVIWVAARRANANSAFSPHQTAKI